MIIPMSCLVMGITAMGISGFYSYAWFIQRGMPVWIAIAMAIIYVGFANIVFEYSMGSFDKLAKYKLKTIGISKKSDNYRAIKIKSTNTLIFGIVQFIGWSALAFYSMYCTVGGQYDQLMNIESSNSIDMATVKDYTRLIELKEKQLADYDEEARKVSLRLDSIETIEERWEYKNTTSATEERLDILRNNINKLSLEIADLYTLQDAKNYKEEFNISTRGFYVYIADLSGGKWDPVMIQFYSSLFPSVVTDIISPICLTIFIMSWKKKKTLAHQR